MLVKIVMKIFQKFFKGDQKLNANEVALNVENGKYKLLDKCIGNLEDLNTIDKSSLVSAINNLLPLVLFNTDKTYSEIADNTKITLSGDITNYKRVKVFGISKGGHLMSCEIYNPQVNDKFNLHYGNPGGRTGSYAYEHYYRMFTFTSGTQIQYNAGTYLTSKLVNYAAPNGFVSDIQLIKIYIVLGYKN